MCCHAHILSNAFRTENAGVRPHTRHRNSWFFFCQSDCRLTSILQPLWRVSFSLFSLVQLDGRLKPDLQWRTISHHDWKLTFKAFFSRKHWLYEAILINTTLQSDLLSIYFFVCFQEEAISEYSCMTEQQPIQTGWSFCILLMKIYCEVQVLYWTVEVWSYWGGLLENKSNCVSFSFGNILKYDACSESAWKKDDTDNHPWICTGDFRNSLLTCYAVWTFRWDTAVASDSQFRNELQLMPVKRFTRSQRLPLIDLPMGLWTTTLTWCTLTRGHVWPQGGDSDVAGELQLSLKVHHELPLSRRSQDASKCCFAHTNPVL